MDIEFFEGFVLLLIEIPEDMGLPSETLVAMMKLFMEYSADVGRASNLHMALVDSKPGGTQNPECKQLAKLLYAMLENPTFTLKKKVNLHDFQKQMDKYPDFLDRKKRLESIVDFDGYILTSSQFKSNKKNLHESENLLGILSRMADAELQQISQEITYCRPMDSLLPQCSDELDDHFYISKKEYPELQTQIEMVKRARTLKTHFMKDVRLRVLFNTNDSKKDKNSMLWNKKTKTFSRRKQCK